MSKEIWIRRARFLATVIGRRASGQDKECPYCGNHVTRLMGRKFVLLEVRRCDQCALMFRWPKDSERYNHHFYQRRYIESTATELPTDVQLAAEIERSFKDSAWDQSEKISHLRRAKPAPARILEFGCSWGYGSFQLKRFGYDVIGFEISRHRAEFASKRLGIKIIGDYAALDSLEEHSFDAIYASHVLEHLPRLTGVFERFARLLRPDGVLAAFVPNCGDGNGRLRNGWRPAVSEKHSMAFDAVFFKSVLPRHGLDADVRIGPGDELMALARPMRVG